MVLMFSTGYHISVIWQNSLSNEGSRIIFQLDLDLVYLAVLSFYVIMAFWFVNNGPLALMQRVFLSFLKVFVNYQVLSSPFSVLSYFHIIDTFMRKKTFYINNPESAFDNFLLFLMNRLWLGLFF